jgi:hypothetical protein
MRAIAAGKKSLAQHRAEESERKRRTRARQRAATESGTVPENRLVQQDDPIEAGQAETDAAEPEQTPELGEQRDAEPTGNSTKKKPESRRSGVAREDTALIYFNERVLDLIQKTKSQKIERFVKTAIPADDLGRLGKFISSLANLVRSRGAISKETMRVEGNGVVPAEQSAEEMKAKLEALEAVNDVTA